MGTASTASPLLPAPPPVGVSWIWTSVPPSARSALPLVAAEPDLAVVGEVSEVGDTGHLAAALLGPQTRHGVLDPLGPAAGAVQDDRDPLG